MKLTEEQVKEFNRCSRDIKYFAEKYIKIADKDLGLTNIKLNETQLDIITKFKANKIFVNYSKRETGKTTIASILLLHAALFDFNKSIVVIGSTMAASRGILERIHMMYSDLPEFLQEEIVHKTTTNMEFIGGSTITACNPNTNTLRGKKIAYLYLDESENFNKLDELLMSFNSTINETEKFDYGKIFVLTSTKTGEILGY